MKTFIQTPKYLFIYALLVPGLLVIASFGCSTGKAGEKSSYDFVQDFGGVADGKTNNYAAFMKAAQFLSHKKNLSLNFPTGIYYIKDYKISAGKYKNDISDIIFMGMDHVTINGNGSSILINGNFKRSADYTLPGVPYLYAYNNTVSPFTFTNCKNLVLKNFILDGGVLQMSRDSNVVEGFNYGIAITDYLPAHESKNIIIDSIQVSHFATDGFIIRSNGKNIKVTNSVFKNNARQGLSIIKGKDIFIQHCNFDSTGFTGNYTGHSPQAGIDVENEYTIDELMNINITRCNFRHNNGFQFVSSSASGKVLLDSCFIADKSNGYEYGYNGVGIYSKNSGIQNSIVFGMLQVETGGEPYRGDVPILIKNNIIYSGFSGAISTDYNNPVEIAGNIFIMLPNPHPNPYFPFIRNQNATFHDNLIILHPDKLKTHASNFTSLLQNVRSASRNFWLVYGNSMSGSKLSSPASRYYKISTDNSRDIGTQYIPEAWLGKAIVHAVGLPAYSIDKLLNHPFITQYKMVTWNGGVLLQADSVRKEMKKISG